MNLNCFVRNGPVVSFDPVGLWSGVAHDVFLEHALGSRVQKWYLNTAKTSSRNVDNLWDQFSRTEYQHYMRSKDQDAEAAIKMWAKWSDDNLIRGKRYADEGKCTEALQEFGKTIHALNDWASPVHADENGKPRIFTGTSGDYSFTDRVGLETSKHITLPILTVQDGLTLNAYDRVFEKSCYCRKRIQIHRN